MLVRRLRSLRPLAVPLLLAIAVTASASGYAVIRVHSGDTLTSLAKRYHTSVAELVALNHLPGNGNLIYAGQSLRVPSSGATSHRTVTTVTTYVVRPGDALDRIARRFHVSPASIASRNHLPRSGMVLIGQRLRIAVPRTTAPAAAGGGSPAVARDRAVLARMRVPSRQSIRTLIRRTAAAWGVPASLALAVADQESGFNMREVSPTDAVGAMQVEPYTATFVSTYLVHRPLSLYDASDNVTAGVALLATLLHETGSTRLAVASYYQGLASVRAHGMGTDTRQYVADVLALQRRF